MVERLKHFLFLIFTLFSGLNQQVLADISPEKQINVREDIWVSSEYKKISAGSSGVRIFVKERKPWIAEYFLIINDSPDSNGLTLLGDNSNRLRILGASEQAQASRSFQVNFGYYNLVGLKGGAYIDLINKSKYSAPVCGIERQYKSNSADSPMKIDFINVVSCGELSLETSSQDYIKTFWKRVKRFDQELSKAFHILN